MDPVVDGHLPNIPLMTPPGIIADQHYDLLRNSQRGRPVQPPAPKLVGNPKVIVDAMLEAEMRRRGLNARDRKLGHGFNMTPAERNQDLLQDLHPSNLAELAWEIENARDPKKIEILQTELKRLLDAYGVLERAKLFPKLPTRPDF